MARMTNFRSAAIATGNTINDSAYDNVKKVSDNMDNINAVNNNKANINFLVTNMGSVVALYSNYDEIKAANEQAALGVMQSINVTANAIGVSTTVGPDQNGVSFGDITIEDGVTITIEDNSSWSII